MELHRGNEPLPSDEVGGGAHYSPYKPPPGPVLKGVQELGVPREDGVFGGASRHDMECGRAAGVKTAAVLWGPFDRPHLEDLSPDYWLEKPGDLRQLYEP